jgi:hypothetical protein
MHTEVLFRFFYTAALSEECFHRLMAFNDERIQTHEMLRLFTKLWKYVRRIKLGNPYSTLMDNHCYIYLYTYKLAMLKIQILSNNVKNRYLVTIIHLEIQEYPKVQV